MGKLGKRRNLVATRRSLPYRNELHKGWMALCEFCDQQQRKTPLEIALNLRALTLLVTDFIQFAYDNSMSFLLARHALLAVQYICRHAKGKMRGAWDAIESWHHELEVSMRPPFPLLVLEALVGLARVLGFAQLESGNYKLATEYFSFALCLDVAFYALLRAGEMFALSSDVVGLPDRHGLSGDFAVIAIEKTKNPRSFGRKQFAVVRHARPTRWLEWALRGSPKGFALWPSTPARFRKRLAFLCKELGVEHCKFVPGSARAGGTTHFYLEGVDPSRLRFWCRHSAEHTLNHYVQEATAALILGKLDPIILARLESLRLACSYTEYPPAASSALCL